MKRIILIRHGDRYDYANPDWKQQIARSGQYKRDPPLSELGERQAAEVAEEVVRLSRSWDNGEVDRIISSPFLRTIQTAQPLARKLKLPIHLEDGLGETRFESGKLPDARQRFAVFPEVNFESKMRVRIEGAEDFPGGYFQRNLKFAGELNAMLEEENLSNVVCYSHAASVALVAGLLKVPLDEDFKFAPCGIYELQKVNGGPWKLIRSGKSNEPYVAFSAASTPAWGFPKADIALFNKLARPKQ